MLVTQFGLACNPGSGDLRARLEEAGLPVFSIQELKAKAESITGVPVRPVSRGRPVGEVMGRDGDLLDLIVAVE